MKDIRLPFTEEKFNHFLMLGVMIFPCLLCISLGVTLILEIPERIDGIVLICVGVGLMVFPIIWHFADKLPAIKFKGEN